MSETRSPQLVAIDAVATRFAELDHDTDRCFTLAVAAVDAMEKAGITVNAPTKGPT
jgi:hypothetical protein